MAEPFDLLVIGAGIVGAACALELARAGLAVGVLERESVGSGATAAGMGHLVVMDDSPAQLALTHYGLALWQDLVRDRPAEHEYRCCGTLWIAADEEEMEEARVKQARYREHGVAAELLPAPALYRREPQLRPGLAGALLAPDDSIVYPPRSAALLMERAHAHGAVLLRGEAVALGAGELILADGRRLRASRLLIANGSRATELVPDLPVLPRKGHLAITDRYPGWLRHQLVELSYIKRAHAASGDSVAFNVQPRPNGQLLIGSSRQFDDRSREVNHTILARMLALAVSYLPALADLAVLRVWIGFRAATPDGLPLVGPHPSREDLWLATGHEGLGITTALATARLLAAQLLGTPCAIPVSPYLPSRSMEVAHG